MREQEQKALERMQTARQAAQAPVPHQGTSGRHIRHKPAAKRHKVVPRAVKPAAHLASAGEPACTNVFITPNVDQLGPVMTCHSCIRVYLGNVVVLLRLCVVKLVGWLVLLKDGMATVTAFLLWTTRCTSAQLVRHLHSKTDIKVVRAHKRWPLDTWLGVLTHG